MNKPNVTAYREVELEIKRIQKFYLENVKRKIPEDVKYLQEVKKYLSDNIAEFTACSDFHEWVMYFIIYLLDPYDWCDVEDLKAKLIGIQSIIKEQSGENNRNINEVVLEYSVKCMQILDKMIEKQTEEENFLMQLEI